MSFAPYDGDVDAPTFDLDAPRADAALGRLVPALAVVFAMLFAGTGLLHLQASRARSERTHRPDSLVGGDRLGGMWAVPSGWPRASSTRA